jgi:hypothetical protein
VYAESQTLLEKHKLAAKYYAMFVSYQSEVPTGKEEPCATLGRGWATLQRWAWEELESFYFKTTAGDRMKIVE